MADTVRIVGIGARTPVGTDSATSAAAVRAGIVGLGAHPFMVDHTGDADARGARRRYRSAHRWAPSDCVASPRALCAKRAPPIDWSPQPVRAALYLGSARDAPGIYAKGTPPPSVPGCQQIVDFADRAHRGASVYRRACRGSGGACRGSRSIEQRRVRSCASSAAWTAISIPTRWNGSTRTASSPAPCPAPGSCPAKGPGFCLLMTDGPASDLALATPGARAARSRSASETKLIKTDGALPRRRLDRDRSRSAVESLAPAGRADQRRSSATSTANATAARSGDSFVCGCRSTSTTRPRTSRRPTAGATWARPRARCSRCSPARRSRGVMPRGRARMLWASSEGGLRACRGARSGQCS